jgi:phage-related baseplate assembly protein
MSMIPSEVHFCETDTAAVERSIIEDYERVAGVTLYPGDPVRLFLEGIAYVIAQQRFLIDYAGRMNLLAYADGDYLDHLGLMLATTRLGQSSARTTLRFNLVESRNHDVVIPQGTRATGDGRLFFATDAEVIIPAGQTQAEAAATSQTPGASANGLVSGQINHLVDPIAYVGEVSNTAMTLGGTNVEVDERYRSRIQLAAERFSTCGPEGAYRWWALGVSQDIIDVGVWSPSPGQVWIAPLMAGGAAPDAELLGEIAAAVNSKRTRPLTDVVKVVEPEPVEYQIDATFWVLHSHASKAGSIQQRAQDETQAYMAWQCTKLGRGVRPSELVARLQGIDGVQRVEINQPVYQALEPWQVARIENVSVIYGGLSGE